MFKKVVALLLVVLLVFPFAVPAKTSAQPRKLAVATNEVRYVYLSQRWLTPKELKRFKDVSGLVLATRLRISNESDWYVTYLARSSGSVLPVGYHYFRTVGVKEWQSLPPARGRREGVPGPEFRGDGYRWLELPPGSSLEFEIYTWSGESEEHFFSAFVKTDSDQEPIEVRSDIFKPLSQR